MHETVTHIASFWVNIDGRVIQRCAVCGEKLCDSKGSMSPLNEDGTTDPFPTFAANALVQVTPGNPTSYCVLSNPMLPHDSCIDLVED